MAAAWIGFGWEIWGEEGDGDLGLGREGVEAEPRERGSGSLSSGPKEL